MLTEGTLKKHDEIVLLGKRIISQEAAALSDLSKKLDGSFVTAVRAILECCGRVAVTGMGKSGHIGRKIAATLASTGTPAYFIHPAEAGHGDLGMMMPEDLVLAISNSGETTELENILGYAGLKSMPIIAITSKIQSHLGKAADIILELPEEHEACPLDCAPTTTTSMALSLGDALAMTVLQQRGFTAKEFHALHPHGALGRRLKSAAEIMHTGNSLPLVYENIPMSMTLLEMTKKGFGCAGVLNTNGELAGVITDGDLRRHMGKDLLDKNATDVMTKSPCTANKSTSTTKILSLMHKEKITAIFITEHGIPCGLVHIHDCEAL